MKQWWNVRRRRSEVEAALRAERPRPREELVASVMESVTGAPAPRRTASRAVFAAAFTIFVLGALVSFGGASYAAAGATHALRAVDRVTAPSHPKTQQRTAASAQYSNPTPKQPKQPVVGQTKGVVTKAVSKPKKPVSPVVTKGQLPFTGLSLATTSVLGFALIALGILLRRRERRSS